LNRNTTVKLEDNLAPKMYLGKKQLTDIADAPISQAQAPDDHISLNYQDLC